MLKATNREKRWIEKQSGQVLVVFALTAVVLFALMGLAIDTGVSYLHSDLQERAADAAALSGVSYLPGDFSDASKEAMLTAQRDGFTNGGEACPQSTSVVVTQPQNNQLEVQITALAPVYFLGLLGFGSHCVSAYADAEYLPPIQLGQPGSQLGSPLGAGGLGSGGNNFYFLRTEGWGNPRSEGDAFTPTPTDSGTGCNGTCSANSPDVHQISCIDGTDTCDSNSLGLQVNDNGGYNYLIYVPAGTSADVQVYNPSFDPGNDDDSTLYTYHDDDSSFPGLSSADDSGVPATDYAAMGFTLYAVTQLYARSGDVPLLQDIFCPFNAWDYDAGSGSEYSYYQAKVTSGHTTTTESGCNPTLSSPTADLTTATSATPPPVYHQWVSLLSYPQSATGTPADLVYQDSNSTLANSLASYGTEVGSTYYLSGGTGTGQYYRLRVDTLSWDGAAINTSTSATSPSVDGNNGSSGDGYPTAHDGYSLRVTTSSGGTCASCTVSAMGDMALYTPIDGATQTSFQVPLFYLPSSYAGKEIEVNVFDPGDVGSGAAYLGIQQPCTGTTLGTCDAPFADLPSGDHIENLGTSLETAGGGTPPGTAITSSDGSTPVAANAAVLQTASSSGNAIYNGEWIQFLVLVPSSYSPNASEYEPGYWNLYYQVAADATAGDTITVQVQYLGSPVHLLPNPQ